MSSVGDSKSKRSYALAGSRSTSGKACQHNGYWYREMGGRQPEPHNLTCFLSYGLQTASLSPNPATLSLAHPGLPFGPKPLPPVSALSKALRPGALYAVSSCTSTQPLKHLHSPHGPWTPPSFTCQGFAMSSMTSTASGQVGS